MLEPPPADQGILQRGASGPFRVLVVQSDIAPAEELLHAFPSEQFHTTFAGDALTVMATATAREVDVVVLDAPLFDVEIDTLLWRLDAERLAVPVVVLGATPPPQPMRLRFPVQYLPKPIAASRIREAVANLAGERRKRMSVPPAADPGAKAGAVQDFLEWSRLTTDLARETGVPAEPAAPEPEPLPPLPAVADAAAEPGTPEPDARLQTPIVPVSRPLRGAAAPAPRAKAGQARTLVAPAAVPSPARPAAAPPAAPGVAVEQLLTTAAGAEPGAGALAERSVVLVGRSTETIARLALVLRDAGMEVRILEGLLPDVLPALRATSPDLLVLEPPGVVELERALGVLRVEVRLWHRPVIVVSADPAVRAAAKIATSRRPEDVLPGDVAQTELLARAAFLLAPVEQVRERMVREKIAAGEIAPIGAAMLVRLACTARPESRLVFRGEGRLAEFDLHNGSISAVLLSEPDGRQVEGKDAILRALTIRTGRFSLRPPPIARRATPDRFDVPGSLLRAADRLTSLLARIAPERLFRARRLHLRDRAGIARGLSSVELRARERLHGGDAPATLLGAPGIDSDLLTRLAEKLVLAGDVVDVEEGGGEPQGVEAAAPAVAEPAVPAVAEAAAPAVAEAAAPAVAEAAPDALAERNRALQGAASSESPPRAEARGSETDSAPPAAEPSDTPSILELADDDLEPAPTALPPSGAPDPNRGLEPAAGIPADSASIMELAELDVEPSPTVAPPAADLRLVRPPVPVVDVADLLQAATSSASQSSIAPPVADRAARPISMAPPPYPSVAPPPEIALPPPAGRPVRHVAAWVALAIALAGGAALLVYTLTRPSAGTSPEGGRAPGRLAAAPQEPSVGDASGSRSLGAGNAADDTAGDVARDAGVEPGVGQATPERATPHADATTAPEVVSAPGPDAAPALDAGPPDAPAALEAVDAAPSEAPSDTAAAVPDGGADGATPADAAPLLVAVGPAAENGASRSGPAVLVVPRPEGVDVAIVVFVDGTRRGEAPLQVELEPGEHEVRFEASGRQSLSIVRLRAGERKTVTPRQLLRDLR